MKNISKLLLVIMALFLAVTGCTSKQVLGEKGQEIITAREALKVVSKENAVLVDAQKSSTYKAGHVEGAVNISRNDITTFGPFPSMLASANQIAKALGKKGISNDTTVVVYDDNNNMDAARLWWTMKVYGHQNVKVVSGGLKALLKAGANTSTIIPEVAAVTYVIEEKNAEMVATTEDVKSQINTPQADVVLVDVRTQEEVNMGTIPGSIHFNYVDNNYDDGTFRPGRQIRTLYKDKGITADQTVILYCKTSIRAAQTYLALYNAGYRNLKVYDGAWIEWSADTSLPVQIPDGANVTSNFQDGS